MTLVQCTNRTTAWRGSHPGTGRLYNGLLAFLVFAVSNGKLRLPQPHYISYALSHRFGGMHNLQHLVHPPVRDSVESMPWSIVYPGNRESFALLDCLRGQGLIDPQCVNTASFAFLERFLYHSHLSDLLSYESAPSSGIYNNVFRHVIGRI